MKKGKSANKNEVLEFKNLIPKENIKFNRRYIVNKIRKLHKGKTKNQRTREKNEKNLEDQFSFLSLLFNSQVIKVFRQKQENERG